MKNTIKTTAIIFTIALIGFLTLSSFYNPDQDIIGTWILEDDTNSKWVFTDNNCYWYYNDNLEDTFTYNIQDLSNVNNSGLLLCGQNVKTGGTEDYYLKLIDQENEEYCYEIMSLNDENLSLNYLGIANIKVFNKQ